MSDKVFVGRRCATVSKPPALEPISKIVLWVDSENCYEAGDNSGREFEITCPYGSQKMANDLLSKLGGYSYQPLEATDALIDPAAELGDAVTVDGRQTILANMSLNFDSLLTADISAPGAAELKPEYTFTGAEKILNRKIARTNSRISKTSEEIRLEVSKTIGELGVDENGNPYTVSSLISQTASSIVSQVTGYLDEDEDGNPVSVSSSIKTALDGITLSVTNGTTSSTIALNRNGVQIGSSQTISMSGLVTFTGLSDGTTTIDGNCIKTGVIDSNRVRVNSLYGSEIYLKFLDYFDYNNDPVYNNGGKITVTGSSTSMLGKAIDLTSFGALRLNAQVGDAYIGSGDGYVTLGGYLGNSCIGFFRPGNDNLYTLGVSWSRWGDIYSSNAEINTSDRNVKDCITYGLDKYLELYKRLQPVSYMFKNGTSGRTHIGFISQDVEEALSACGLTSLDFAGFVKSPKRDDNEQVIEGKYDYALRYGEFIALNTYMIQKLMARVDELERRQTA